MASAEYVSLTDDRATTRAPEAPTPVMKAVMYRIVSDGARALPIAPAVYTAMPEYRITLRPSESDKGPHATWPMARPARAEVITGATALEPGGSPNSLRIVANAGRVMSIARAASAIVSEMVTTNERREIPCISLVVVASDDSKPEPLILEYSRSDTMLLISQGRCQRLQAGLKSTSHSMSQRTGPHVAFPRSPSRGCYDTR